MRYPHVPEQYQPLLEHWEAVLRDEPDPNAKCIFCGEEIPKGRAPRGPRRLYCSGRCQRAASRARKDRGPSEWMPKVTNTGLLDQAEADGVGYVDAFPGDHPPLNYPVVPKDTDFTSEFGWAGEIIGRG